MANPQFDVLPVGVKSLLGERFGRLVVVGFSGTYDRRCQNRIKRLAEWACRCDCGNKIVARGENLRKLIVRSCGCLRSETQRKNGLRSGSHYMSGAPEYRAWRGMINRCTNPNTANFSDYGGRGICVCDRWLRSFEAFYEDVGPRPDGMSIDRIDNNGNYEPQNVRWADDFTQAGNRRSTHYIECRGEMVSVSQAAAITGIPVSTIKSRIKRGCPAHLLFVSDVRDLS